MSVTAGWLWLIALGAYHGINPGMGWLFAVALGMQEQRRSAVWRALWPIALGHALSIGIVVAVVLMLERQIPTRAVRVGAACVLFGFGVYRLLSSRHPRWGGMRVGWRDLTIWSFVMASAHGAGLMLVPVILGWPGQPAQDAAMAAHLTSTAHSQGAEPAIDVAKKRNHESTPDNSAPEEQHRAGTGGHAGHQGALQAATGGTVALGLLAVGVHTFAYLVVTAAIAVVVYEKLGLAMLRRAWWNLDVVWAVALIVTGVLTLVIPT
jgi:hypothetical protein